MTPTSPHHHRPVLDEELGKLRALVMGMGELVDGGISRAMAGLATRDVDRCTTVIAEDAHLNTLHKNVRELCFAILLFAAELDEHRLAALAGDGLAALSGEDHHAAAEVEDVETVAVMGMR